MSVIKDLHSNVKMLPALSNITDFASDIEGPLIDVSPYKGIGILILRVYEDASQANTEKLDITVHKVDADSETLDSDNQIATFTQIVGSNGSAAQLTDQVIAINLDLVDTKYIQLNLVETNTYEALLDCLLIVAGASQLPISQP